MSSGHGFVYPPKQKCEWCSRQSDEINNGKNCDHRLCKDCLIKHSQCRSDCPRCWEKNITRFLNDNRICAGKKFILLNRRREIHCFDHSLCDWDKMGSDNFFMSWKTFVLFELSL